MIVNGTIIRTFIFLSVLWLTDTVSVQAQKFIPVKFSAADHLMEIRLPRRPKIRLNDSVTLYRLFNQLRTKSFAHGYLEFSIDSVKFTDTLVRAIYHSGSRYHFGQISLKGLPDGIPGRQLRYLDGSSSPVDPDRLLTTFEKGLELYDRTGYPFARVRLDSITIHNQEVSGTLCFDPGLLIRMDSVLNRTKVAVSNRVLSKLIGIAPGEVYNEKRIQEVSTRINATGFLFQKRAPEVGFFDDKAWLFIYPEPLHANRLDGWVGLASAPSGRGMTFMGSVDLSLRNILHQAGTWNLKWNRNQDHSQHLSVHTQVPWFLGLPLGVNGTLDLFRQDTSFMNINASAGILYHFTPAHSLTLQISYLESNLLSQFDSPLLSGYHSFKIWLTGLVWQSERWKNQLNPVSGYHLKTEVATGVKTGFEKETGRQAELRFNGSIAHPLWGKWVFFSWTNAAFRVAPGSLVNEQFRIGGMHFLRGFDEEVFRADRYVTGGVELRYRMDNISYLVAFADLGYLTDLQGESPTVIRPLGIGLGGQIKTSAGIFKIFYALGHTAGQPFSFSSAKVHLGYAGLF